MSCDRGIKDVGSLLQSRAQFELFQRGTFSNAKDSGSSVTAQKCMQKQYVFAGKELGGSCYNERTSKSVSSPTDTVS